MNVRLVIFFLLSHLFSQNTNIPQSVISSGAVLSESEQTILVGTLGQVFTNKVTSANTVLTSGFWGSVAQTLGVVDFVPEEFSISTAYPNPFNPTVNIDFSIPEITNTTIQVFDLVGKNIFTHKQNFVNPGKYRFQWNAKDNNGKDVASGIYIVSIQNKKNIYQQKITLLK